MKKFTFSDWKKSLLSFVVLGLLLFLFSLLSLRFGSTDMSTKEFFGAFGKDPAFQTHAVILWELRLPRLLAGIVAGMGLAVSGVILQTVTDNHMAGPNIVGVNSGAGFMVLFALGVLGVSPFSTPVFAFLGALIATSVIIALSAKMGSTKYTIVLTGLAVNAVFSAGISFLALLDSDLLVSYQSFSLGTLEGSAYNTLIFPAILVVLSFAVGWFFSDKLNLLILGDSLAHSLGLRVKRIKILCMVLASASAAAVVSFAGLLGFVGLIAPHVARLLFGANLKKLLPASALCGAVLVVAADFLGKVIFAPSELPVGIFMAVLGAPFFLFLLLKGRKTNA